MASFHFFIYGFISEFEKKRGVICDPNHHFFSNFHRALEKRKQNPLFEFCLYALIYHEVSRKALTDIMEVG